VNGKKQKEIPGIQYEYAVATGGRQLNQKKLMDMGIYKSEISYNSDLSMLQVTLTKAMADELSENKLVKKLEPLIRQKEYYDNTLFPQDNRYQWNLDQYGPIYIPKKGATIDINLDNLPFTNVL
jgi:signal peptidase I